MMKSHFEDLAAGIQAALENEPEHRSPRKIYALEIARLGSRLYSGEERVAWCGVTAPFDLLAAMGVTSCFVEFVGAMLASTGMVGGFLEEAEKAGMAGDTCGYHRSVLGAARNQMMPVPDFLIATSSPCTGGLALMENLARHFEKDLFVLNVPQEPSDAGVRYLADQIRDLTAFVSDHTGEPLSEDRLREAVCHTNRARDILDEVYRLVQTQPSPADSRILGNFGIVMALLLGTEAAVTVAEAYRDEFEKRVTGGVSGVPGERIRLMWLQNRIQFKNPLIDMLEKEYGAVVLADELNAITWDAIDPDDPFTGMARRAISIPFNGPGGRRVDHLRRMARDFRVDGAINPCHWGCRQGTGARGIISEGLKDIGVPVLNLEVDCVDDRNFSEGQLRTRLEAFAEMLDGRPSPWG
jgi:benzoyl-CoA reductase/2-hydroxyglutaryl-CoA dehydratase subunit BcrC/BadD/HgdB